MHLFTWHICLSLLCIRLLELGQASSFCITIKQNGGILKESSLFLFLKQQWTTPGTRTTKNFVLQVLEERNQLHAAWQNKKVYLDQLIDLQFFLRDVKQLDSLCIAQEAALSSSECGETVEEVDALVGFFETENSMRKSWDASNVFANLNFSFKLKKHLAFENVVEAQEEKLEVLKLHGAKLIEQNHFYSPNIKTHIDDVAGRRAKVKVAAL